MSINAQPARCEVCRFPIIGADRLPICVDCTMIAAGDKYPDGSDPAKGLHGDEIAYIQMRVRSILFARSARLAV